MKILIKIISLILILIFNLLQIPQLQAQCHIDDWTALKALYESTDGDNWTNNTGWEQVTGTTPPVDCDLEIMHGVTLQSGRVGDVSLSNNQLSGSIPAEIESLIYLRGLNLNINQLSGNIPAEIGNLTFLNNLNLRNNQLSGNIPVEIGNLAFLNDLHLWNNQLNGNIPAEIGNLTFLNDLHLYNNQLSGNIPAEIGNLNSLITLDLNNNLIIGSIPEEIGNLNNLVTLYLDYNLLSGSIPPAIGNLNSLNSLRLNSNLLSGNIPSEIGNLTNLGDLRLSGNQLSGSIPPAIGNLNSLTYLALAGNQLSGCYDENLISFCSLANNALISSGNYFDAAWGDFCNTGAGTCPVAPDDVLPGDGNGDGIVDNKDALYWALAESFSGIVRPNATTDCTLQTCPDWSQYVNDVNCKHQDGDGSGTVDVNDLQVIISNYGCVSDYTTPDYASGTPIYRVQPQGINNDKYQYDLYVENGSGAAAIAHGLAFTVSSDVIPISAIAMSTTGSSLHPDEAFAISDGNQCHVVLTRTDNLDVICDGSIATFVVETGDIPVGIPFEIDVAYGSKIKADATLENVTGATAFGMYNGFVPSSSNIFLDAPVTHEQCNGLGEALVIPSGGIPPYTYSWSNGANTAQVNNLTSGTYTVTVTDSNGLNQNLNLQINGQTPIYDANGNLLCSNLCPEYLAPSGITGNGLYRANNALNSDAIIPTGNIAQYKAGQTIELKSGFKVQPNAEFSAEIEDCQ